MVCAGVFEALGHGRESLTVTLLRQLILILPLGWLLSRFWGAAGIWICFPIAECAAVCYTLRKIRKIV